MRTLHSIQPTLILVFLFLATLLGFAQKKPNVIFIFPDNLGVGEVAAYGGARGVPTPNIDRIGTEGIRLTNFNVEYAYTPSRIAIRTGRYAVRAGKKIRYVRGGKQTPVYNRTVLS